LEAGSALNVTLHEEKTDETTRKPAIISSGQKMPGGDRAQPFQIVGINQDEEQNAKKAVQKERMTWPSFKDYLLKEKRQISRRWNVHSWPAVFVIDHEGVIRHKFIGKPEDKELDQALDALVTAAASSMKPAKK
jgi:hypothetical protein